MVRDLDTGEQHVLINGYLGAYSPSGHIIYQQSPDVATIFAAPFSADTLEITGDPFPIAENAREPTVAVDGTLAYVDGAFRFRQQLNWRDRSGARLRTVGRPYDRVELPELSPDEKLFAFCAVVSENMDIYVHDRERSLTTRLTFDPAIEDRPIWIPGDNRLSFSSDRDGSYDIFLKPADGSGAPEKLLDRPGNEFGVDWSRDGEHLLWVDVKDSAGDIWRLRRNPDGAEPEVEPLLTGEADESSPRFSPDGRYFAYVSNESGKNEVYVRPFPEGGGRWQVSQGGGSQPRWRGDGKELFYVSEGAVYAAHVSTQPTFAPGGSTLLFEDKDAFGGRGQRYDVTADGQHFVLMNIVREETKVSIHVVQNWFSEFRDSDR